MIFGLLDVIVIAVVATGKINGKMLQGRSEAESEVTGNTAGMDGFLAILDDAVEVVVPGDALVEVVSAKFELI